MPRFPRLRAAPQRWARWRDANGKPRRVGARRAQRPGRTPTPPRVELLLGSGTPTAGALRERRKLCRVGFGPIPFSAEKTLAVHRLLNIIGR
jgi:hypothetical protein